MSTNKGMTYERAFELAKQKTVMGIPAIPSATFRGGDRYVVRRVPASSSWPRGRNGKLCGSENRNARALKMTEQDVRDLREAYGDGGRVTMDWLSRYYGIAIGHVCNIIHGQRWADVEPAA